METTLDEKTPLKIKYLRIQETKKNRPEPCGFGAACILGGASLIRTGDLRIMIPSL